MNYAPIIIPTLNRAQHLQKCIQSLSKNKYACNTSLIISVDYPPDDRYIEGYKEVCNYLKKPIDGFADVEIIYQSENKGAFGVDSNYSFLVEYVSQKWDTFIYTEDDNVFSPNFLEYVNICLEKYRDDDSVVAVSGYFWPVNVTGSNDVFKMNSVFSAWGYATWTEKFNKMTNNICLESFERILHRSQIINRLRKDNPFIFTELIKGYFEYAGCLMKDGQVQPIDLAYGVVMFARGYNMIYPAVSKVRNCGNDGSGVNCAKLIADSEGIATNRNYDYSFQPIDDNLQFEIAGSEFESEQVNSAVKTFLIAPKREIFKCSFLYFIYRIIGRDNCVKLVHKLFSSE